MLLNHGMAISDLLSLLTKKGTHERNPSATLEDVRLSEEASGRRLPQDFVDFVTSFSNGAYLFEIQEVASVGKETPGAQIGPVMPAARWLGESLFGRIPVDGGGDASGEDLVAFSLDSNGNAWCFLTEDSAGGTPVAYYAAEQERLFGRLDSFEAWLERLIEHEDEVIRTTYDEDFIYDVLGLG